MEHQSLLDLITEAMVEQWEELDLSGNWQEELDLLQEDEERQQLDKKQLMVLPEELWELGACDFLRRKIKSSC
jgi:hypothetical protein